MKKINKINLRNIIRKSKPGDILLTNETSTLGKTIKWFQKLPNDPVNYTHVAIIPQKLSTHHLVLEANKTLGYYPIERYLKKSVCLLRHVDMCNEYYIRGYNAIQENLGQPYPYYRLILHAIDSLINKSLQMFHVKPRAYLTKLINTNHPVCSELAKKFMVNALNQNVDWQGVVPDDFEDLHEYYPEIWKVIAKGVLVDD